MVHDVSIHRYTIIGDLRCLPFVKFLASFYAPEDAMWQYYSVVQLAHGLVGLL